MNIKKSFSLKLLAMIQMISIGLIVVLLTYYYSYRLQAVAKQKHQESAVRILDVSSHEALKKAEEYMLSLSNDLTGNVSLRKKVKQYLKEKNIAYLNDITPFFDGQFEQRFVTTELIDLQQIRLYDLEFNLIVESKTGNLNIPKKLSAMLLDVAEKRKKADRLKRVSALWLDNGEPYFSVLLPFGGFRIAGYIEIVIAPALSLKVVELMTALPLKVDTLAGKTLYKNKEWDKLTAGENIVITQAIKNSKGQDILKISALEDISKLSSEFDKALYEMIGVFLIMIIVSSFVMIKSIQKILLNPVHMLVDRMNRVAKGDLQSVEHKSLLISELDLLQESMNNLTDKLHGHILLICQTGGQLTRAAGLLGENATNTVDRLRNQQQEIINVTNATNSLMTAVQGVAETANETTSFSQTADADSQSGKEIVLKAVEGIKLLSNEVSNASNEIGRLKGDISNVGSILEAIQNISDQTNLLALNAAIEAARAGEQGRGFAVVADEVRALAGRSKTATEEVNSILNNLQQNITNSVLIMDQGKELADSSVKQANDAANSLTNITQNVSTISSMNVDISNIASIQVQTTAEISMYLLKINEMADSVAQDTTNLNSNSADLSQMASQLEMLVSRFKLDVDESIQINSSSEDEDNVELF